MEQTPAPEQTNPSSPTSQTGYTQRPANARTQVYNRYLDSCTIKVDNINYTSTVQVQDTNLITVWKLARRTAEYTTGKRALFIPVAWTYLITWYMSNDVNYAYGWYMQKNNATFIWNRDWPAPWNTQILQPVSTIMNFEKWDFFNVETWSHSTNTVDIRITLTKLS